jgi:hypothetical protein
LCPHETGIVSIDNALSTAQITYLRIRIIEGENDCNPLAGRPVLEIRRILKYNTVIAEGLNEISRIFDLLTGNLDRNQMNKILRRNADHPFTILPTNIKIYVFRITIFSQKLQCVRVDLKWKINSVQ